MAERWIGLRYGVAAGVMLAGAIGAARADLCPKAASEAVQVAGVEARLELRLADGRTIRLAGLDPASSTPEQPDRDERSRRAFSDFVAGRAVTLQVLAPQPDRWGRVPAFAFLAAADGQPGGLAATAIGAGWGRYLPEPAASACRDSFLAQEAAARAGALGLWADPYYAVLAVDDLSGFTERAGTLVTVEGRLAAVTPNPYRTRLVFAAEARGSHGGHLLSATILPRVIKMFEGRGMHLSSLVGHRLRLRGLLDLRFGPQIELTGPDSLEVADAAPDGNDVEAK